MDRRPIAVVTAADDPTADLVIRELHDRCVPVVRFDAADFPAALTLSARVGAGHGLHGQLRTTSRTADLSALRSLYYRRPTHFSFAHLSEQDARFAVAQARYGLGGVLASLPGCLYLNHPHRIADAEFKPSQLAVAVHAGFAVPPTLITNDPEDARAFAAAHQSVVYKPLWSTAHMLNGQPGVVWVGDVDAGDIDGSVSATAHLFQAKVAKIADVRVTVVGDQVFAVRIDSDLLDWREDYDRITAYTVIRPPSELDRALHAYLQRFGLMFGCFDFAVTARGEWVFLECNPNGQWAWLEPPTGLPMTAAIASLLEKGSS